MHQIQITLLRDEADEVRPILRQHLRNGTWFTERRMWFFWVRFTISGHSTAIAALQGDLDAWSAENFIRDAW